MHLLFAELIKATENSSAGFRAAAAMLIGTPHDEKPVSKERLTGFGQALTAPRARETIGRMCRLC